MFLALQNTYEELQIALFNAYDLVDWRTIPKIHASTLFINTVQELLDTHQLALSTIPFIAVNQGPGPFTTLRVVIASANGLSFASKIPLIGIDGLQAFIEEHHSPNYPNTVVLLNAFNQDVYFAIQADKKVETGYNNIDVLLDLIKNNTPNKPIRFLGNGTQMHQEKIMAVFGANAYIPDPIPLYCSITQIGIMGYEQWQKHTPSTHHLQPIYLKRHPAQQ